MLNLLSHFQAITENYMYHVMEWDKLGQDVLSTKENKYMSTTNL